MAPIELASYPKTVVFAGAGFSAESGVPTYRGRGGIWHQYNYEDYACQRAFDRDSARVLDFHEVRRKAVLSCQPHAGHERLRELQDRYDGLVVVTQNIDGLFQRAGVRVEAELHGSLWRLRCRCGVRTDVSGGPYVTRRCTLCCEDLRPDITWFEDPVDPTVFSRAENLIACCNLFVSVGTSGVVWPAAGLAELARRSGARMVEVNPQENEASYLYGDALRVPASEGLEFLR